MLRDLLGVVAPSESLSRPRAWSRHSPTTVPAFDWNGHLGGFAEKLADFKPESIARPHHGVWFGNEQEIKSTTVASSWRHA